jgi:hypothetical protein
VADPDSNNVIVLADCDVTEEQKRPIAIPEQTDAMSPRDDMMEE